MDLSIYDEFVADYNNPLLTVDDVRRRCGLNTHRYAEIKQIAVTNGDIQPKRQMNRTDAKFFTKTERGYIVKKQFGSECVFVGRFANQSTAEAVVDKCKEVNWNVSEISDFIEAHRIKPRNYSYSNDRYIIQKVINGKNIVFCTVNTEEAAQQVVEKLRECNWDYSQMDRILQETMVMV